MGGTVTRQRSRWPALLLVMATAGLVSRGGVPLYDGVGFPDQPYRYVKAPAGVTHGPPPEPAIRAVSPIRNGTNRDPLEPQSDEQGPQVFLGLPADALHVGALARSVTVTVSALAPGAQPADGRIDGNVYRVAVRSQPDGPVSFAGGNGPSLLYLRAASLQPAAPVMEHRTSSAGAWLPLPTSRSGQDVFVVAYGGAGDYALVHQGGAKPTGGVSAQSLLLLLLAGFVLLVVLAAVLVRRPWQNGGPAGGADLRDAE